MRSIVFAVVLTVLSGGCGSGPTDKKPNPTQPDVSAGNRNEGVGSASPELKLTVEPKADSVLSLRLVFKNTLKREIYVFSPLPRYNERTKVNEPDRKRVYVSWQTDSAGGVLKLSKCLWPTPKDVEVHLVEVPWLTRLAPGATLEQELLLEPPVLIDFPYMTAFQPKKDSKVPAKFPQARSLVFAIGYVEGDPKELYIEPAEDGLFKIPYGHGIANQKFIEQTANVQIPVCE